MGANWTPEEVAERERIMKQQTARDLYASLAQFASPLPPASPVLRKRRAAVPAVSEAVIQRTCEDILIWDDWRIFRLEQNYSERKRKVIGERGAPDGLYVRYDPKFPGAPRTRRSVVPTDVDLLFIEWKRLKGKLGPHQRAWHDTERARGALTLIAGIDFEASIEGFQAWYKSSGLQRKA